MSGPAAGSARLRVMTYNVHGCVGGDRRLDVTRIAEVIAREEPDVVALQELDVCRARSGRVDQAHEIARRLGMSHHFHAAFAVAEERYGDAILSRLPIRAVKAGPLPRPARARLLEMRGAVWVEIEAAAGVRLQVVNTHLGLVPLEQAGQVEVLLGSEWVGSAGFRAGPGLVMGDFNATSRYAAYRRLASALRDLQRERPGGPGGRTLRTFPARTPLLRIDHLFASGSVRADAIWTPATPAARIASDHRPLVADLLIG